MVYHTLESAHAAVVGLVEDFAANEAHYLSPGYSEAQARVSFIDKFWMALGWDVHHEHQKNPYAQEVKVEDPQKIEGSSRRADYAFFTAPDFGHPRFFCEAKKPSVQLKTDADAAFQTLRYGKSADTPLAVLTDFEQIHILDCRVKPDIDTALARKHLGFHYKDWLKADVFAKFYYLFSREAFADGGFEAYVTALPKPRKVGTQLGLLRAGSQPVGNDFLDDLEGHRQTLAALLHAADPALDGDALTELVQRVLDRLIFLRFLEDKLIETEIQVQDFSRAAGGHAWRKFLVASRKLDTRYNGIVFKHHPLLDVPGRLPVDDGGFADLCERLAYARSPYNLHYIPVQVLGSIYERFLGKVINAQGGVEEKPEVRKAGGVYYTPEYIVRYICEGTVGRLVEGKSPAQIARLRFADIACGSGSFLLGVYDLLLRTHGLWYNANRAEALKENLAPPDKAKKRRKEFVPAVVEHEGVLRLTLEKKREILLNNVFGVDLDPQAVEVAQFSLYLKLLEDETTASAHQHYLDFAEALLPSLKDNVVRGNSLVGTDILEGKFEFSAREERKLAPMNFQNAFPAAMREGGFDAIVGNPPYGADIPARLAPFLREKYASLANSLDSFILFVERAAGLLQSGGQLGYIIPSGWVSTPSSAKLRGVFIDAFKPSVFASLPYDVFEGAYVDTMIVTAERLAPKETWANRSDKTVKLVVFPVRYRVKELSDFEEFSKVGDFTSWDRPIENGFLVTASAAEAALVRKLRKQSKRLNDYAEVMRGIETFNAQSNTGLTYPKRALTGDIYRYRLNHDRAEGFVDYPADIEAGKPLRFFSGPRLLLRQLLSRKFRLQAVYTEEEFLTNQSVQSILARETEGISPKAILGLLNSALLSWYFCQTNMVARRDDFPKTIIKVTRELPFPKFNVSKPADKKQHDRMVQLVESMLATQQQLTAASSETDRDYYKGKAAGLDRQIDALVYALYGLTPEEIALVEAGA